MKPMMKPGVENLALWNKLFETDPSYTKDFKRSGGFQGTAITPMLAVFRLTEEFGPIGIGWGIEEQDREVVYTPDALGEILIYIRGAIWYMKDGKRCIAGPQWGGDKIVSKYSSGLKSDDEAFKKAMTDAFMKCAAYLGIGADIHSGMFDDVKYFKELGEKFTEKKPEVDGPSEDALNDRWMEVYKLGEEAGLSVDDIRKAGKERIPEWLTKAGLTNKSPKAERNKIIFEGLAVWVKELKAVIADASKNTDTTTP